MAEQIERRISFNGGEVSAWTDPRVDLDKYRSSCRRLTNMQPTIYGGAFRRAGTNYIDTGLSGLEDARLESFEFSINSGTYRVNVLFEFGDGYVSFLLPTQRLAAPTTLWMPLKAYKKDDYIVNFPDFSTVYRATVDHVSDDFAVDLAAGKWVVATAYTLTTPYTAEEAFELQFVQQNDVIFVSHPNHQPRVISRIADYQFQIALFETEWPATRDENILDITITPSAVTGTTTLTASQDIFQPGHVGSRWIITHRREDPSVDLKLTGATLGATSDPLYVLDEWSCTIRSANSSDYAYDVRIVVQRSYDKVNWETLRTLGSERASIQGSVSGTEIDPCWLRIMLIEKTGTLPNGLSASIEALDPDHYGIVQITGYTSATQVTAQVLFELGGTTATKKWNEAAWSDFRGWPRALCLHEQRLYFAGNLAQPQTIWGSIVDDFTNYRVGTDDDMALALTISADQSFGIVWILSQESLIVGTGGSEWVIGGRDSNTIITPSTARAKRSSSFGSEAIQALAAQDASLFVERSARKVREIFYSFERDNLTANDLVLLSEHITGTGIKQIAIQKNPSTVLWCLTNDGRIIGLVYERGQNVAGWFQVVCGNPNDRWTSIAVGDATVFASARRTINGTSRPYIEYFQPGHLDILRLYTSGPCPDGLVFSDASITLEPGAPTTTFTGLSHLEGRTVNVMADGVVHPDRVVSGGSITTDFEAERLVVGLPYESILEPTWLETNDPSSLSKAAKKKVFRVLMEFYRSLGCEVSTDGITFDRVPFREIDTINAPDLFTGLKEQTVPGSTARQVSIIIRQTQPLPLVLLSLHVSSDLNRI